MVLSALIVNLVVKSSVYLTFGMLILNFIGGMSEILSPQTVE